MNNSLELAHRFRADLVDPIEQTTSVVYHVEAVKPPANIYNIFAFAQRLLKVFEIYCIIYHLLKFSFLLSSK